MKLYLRSFPTPLGRAAACVDQDGAAVALTLHRDVDVPPHFAAGATPDDDGRADALVREVDEYFAARRRRFETSLRPRGTAFQLAVWQALAEIPFGETTTYGELARRLGKPGAVRAVGAANGANPLWLVLPCHRVVGADGKLTGYAGGLALKRALLEHEGLKVAGERVSREPELFA
jgi:methylated-DNA-[protein]-cysteine S-methyltransferase